jgi:hypothetical protein
MKHRRSIFLAQVEPVRIPQKVRQNTLHQTCIFESGRISGSISAFWCILGTKTRFTIFDAQVRPVQIPQKACCDTVR